MTATAYDGPLSVIGQRPPMIGPAQPTGAVPAILEYNPDLSPILLHGGNGVRDPRYMPRIGQGPQTAGGIPNQDCGWYDTGVGGIALIDAVPQALGAANIVANAPATSATLVLTTTTTAAITVIGSGGYSLPCPVGANVPARSLALDGVSDYVGGGQSGAFQFFDPTTSLARAVSVTAAAGATATSALITGMDVYGVLMHEQIPITAGSTVNGKKAFKYIISVVLNAADAGHNYSVGTTDIFGLPMRLASFPSGYATIYYPAPTQVTAGTGYTAGVTTPATALTGDVRGTYALQAASNGTNRLQVFSGLSVAQAIAANLATYTTNLLGVAQF